MDVLNFVQLNFLHVTLYNYYTNCLACKLQTQSALEILDSSSYIIAD